jgi:hypothetical protein
MKSIATKVGLLAVIASAAAFAQSPNLFVVGPNWAAQGTTPTVRIFGSQLAIDGSFILTSQLCFTTNITNATCSAPDGMVLAPTITDNNTFTFTMPAAATATPGIGFVFVRQTTPFAAGTSNLLSFYIRASGPTLTSISPTNSIVGSSDRNIIGTGANIGSGAGQLRYIIPGFGGPGTLTTTGSTATTVTGTLPSFTMGGVRTVFIFADNAPSDGSQNSEFRSFAVLPPSLTNVVPNSAVVGTPGITNFTLNGTFQTPGPNASGTMFVRFTPPPTAPPIEIFTFTTATQSQLVVNLPASALTAAGTATVQVCSAPNETEVCSNSVNFVITPPIPPPAITSINPTSAVAGGAQLNVVLTGTNFNSGGTPTVTWTNGGSTNLTIVGTPTATSITATIPAALITTAGTAQIRVISGAQTSNAATFTINPAPTVSFVSPDAGFAGDTATSIFVGGSNFLSAPNPIVRFTPPGGVATTLTTVGTPTATGIQATIPAALLANVGTASVVVQTGGVNSNAVTFTIRPSPAITSISPTGVTAGSPTFNLTVNGTNLTQPNFDTTLSFNGTRLFATTQSATQAVFSVPANLVATPGSVQVRVELLEFNAVQSNSRLPRPAAARPLPMVGPNSNFFTFTIFGAPTITTLNPTRTTAGNPTFNLTITGTNFRTGDTVDFNGTTLTPSSITATQIIVSVPSVQVTTPGFRNVRVVSNLNASSNTAPFIVDYNITLLNPTFVTQGSPAFNLTVTASTTIGEGAQVTFNGTPLQTVGFNANSITASVPASLITTAGIVPVRIVEGQGISSNALNFTILGPINITSLNPSFVQAVQAGGPGITLTVNGSGFDNGTVVSFNRVALPTTFVSPTQVTVALGSNFISTPGIRDVVATDSRGRSSNTFAFPVLAQINITQLNPSQVEVGAASFTLTLNGTGFENVSVVTFNGTSLATTFVSAGQLTAVVPAALVASAGTFDVVVRDNRGRSSNALPFIVGSSLQLTSINPSTAEIGSASFTLTATGAGFSAPAAINFGSTQVPATVVSPTQVTAVIPANLLTTAAVVPVSVQVTNASGSGVRTTNSVNFTITSTLTLTSLNPSLVEAGSAAFTLTANGVGFSGPATLNFGSTQIPATVVNATQVTASIPASLVGSPAVVPVSVQVTNANGAGTRTTNSINFSVVSPLRLTALGPNRANAGSLGFTLSVNGEGFVNGANIRFNGANVPTTFVNGTTLTGQVPATLLVAPGNADVVVVLPDGRTSNALTFTLLPILRLTSINPPTVNRGGNGVTITLTGEGFVQESIVRLGTLNIPTTFVSGTQLTAVVADVFLADSATFDISVLNPGNAISNSLPFGVGGSTFTLISVSPTGAALNSPSTQIILTGTGFASGMVARFNSNDLATTFISSTQLNAVIPAEFLRVAGTFPISVFSGNVSSNAVNFDVGGRPEITFLNPNSITAGARGFNLIVLGRGFQAGAVIRFGDNELTTTFVSASQLSAPISTELLAAARTVPVTVTNPRGETSNSVDFRIVNLTLTSITPDRATVGGAAFTLALEGTGFISGATVSFGGTGLVTTVGGATSASASVPASALTNAGVIEVTIANPDGARSNSIRFTIESGVPTITRINPNSVLAGTGEVNLAVTGGGYVRGSTVTANGNSVSTEFTSATSLDAVIPASLTQNIGSVVIRVVNPGGAESNAVNLAVTAPTPAISNVNPGSVNAGSTVDITIAITGSGFVEGSSVLFNGSGIETSFGSRTSLSAVIPVGQLANPANATIQVVNPGDLRSNTVQFQILGPLSVTAINPTTIVGGGNTPANISVTGVGFVNGSTVMLGSNALSTSFGSATSLSAVIPPNLLATAGTFGISVSNPNGAVSNSVNLRIDAPITPPVLDLQVPAVITPAGSGRVQVTLASPAPVALSGTLTLNFNNNSNNAPAGYIDPALLFAGTGNRQITFTIAQGSTTAVISGDGAFSPGTVAGTIVVTISALTGGGQNLLPNPAPTRQITVDRTVPVIVPGTVRITNITGGFQVELSGVSSPRDLVRISYTFTATGTSILEGTTVTVDVTSLFNTYFASDAGRAAGGAFRFTMPFTVSGGDANAVTSVSVTLTNSVGNSTVVSGGR